MTSATDSTPSPADPPELTAAVEQLAATGAADLVDRNGSQLAVVIRAIRGNTLRVQAPRLRVAEDQQLLGRVVGADGRPWLLELRVTAAAYESDEHAKVELEATGIRADSSRRQSERSSMGGVVRLTAVHCRDIVDGEVLEGTIVDLAPGGIAIASRRVLRVGDRFAMAGRFFNETLEAEVRVRAVRAALSPGQNVYGCAFIHIAPAEAQKLDRLLEDPGHGRGSVDLGELRRLADGPAGDSAAGSRRFRLFGS